MNIFKKAYCRTYQQTMRLLECFLPWREPEPLKGEGMLAALPEYLGKLNKGRGVRSVLLVTDGGIAKLGLCDPLKDALAAAGIKCTVFDGVVPNPTIENIEQCTRLYHEGGCEAIVAVGGGSPMDCAKVCAARVANPKKPVAKMEGVLKIRGKLPPLIAVPTTAGTGSETTLAAVVTDPAQQRKYAINDPQLIPLAAVLDPTLTVGLPKGITATTGMDALCHAVEAYVGQANTRATRRNALEATEMIFRYLPRAYADGSDMEARCGMQEAAYKAGLAFTRAYVGSVHAMAHAVGGTYGTAHGLANAVIMPHVLRAYGSRVYKRLAEMCDAAGLEAPAGADARRKAELFISAIEGMNREMGIPEHLSEIEPEDIPHLAECADRETNPGYPVPVMFGKKEYAQLYMKVRG